MNKEFKFSEIITYISATALISSVLYIKGYSSIIGVEIALFFTLNDFINYSVQILPVMGLGAIFGAFEKYLNDNDKRYFKTINLIRGSFLLCIILQIFKLYLVIAIMILLTTPIFLGKNDNFRKSFLKYSVDQSIFFLLFIAVTSFPFGIIRGYLEIIKDKNYNKTIKGENINFSNANILFSLEKYLIIKTSETGEISILQKDKVENIFVENKKK